jgi:thymidylate kinase
MRIAFSGTASSGKSTLTNAFLKRWPMYTTPTKTYRDIIVENNLEHSSKTSEETQLLILNWMMEEQAKYTKNSNVVFDRCPWDNLAYTLQGNAAGLISDEVTAASISFVKESLKNIDIIFWIRYSPSIKIVADGLRDVDENFIKATDTIFSDLYHQYCENLESDIFYPKEDCPAIIQLDGTTVDDRLWFISQFIDYNGKLIETTDSILDPSNADLLETMIKEQQIEQSKDIQFKNLVNQIKKTR